MPDEIALQLLAWGEEMGAAAGAEVIAVDFRRSGSIRAALIGVKNVFSVGALAPQLIAMAFNVIRASEIECAVKASGVPYTFMRLKSFDVAQTLLSVPAQTRVSGPQAAVISDDGKTDDFIEPVSNHQVVKILSRITKRPVVYVDVPDNIARQSMRQLGMPASLIETLAIGASRMHVSFLARQA